MNRRKEGRRILAMLLSMSLVASSGDFVMQAKGAESAADYTQTTTMEADGNDVAVDVQGTNDGSDRTDYCHIDKYGNLQLDMDKIDAAEETEVTVTIPKNATTIRAGIFDAGNCSFKIAKVVIPQGSQLESIADNAFKNSPIKALTIAADVPIKSIGDNAFTGSQMESIIFESDEEVDLGGEAGISVFSARQTEGYITWGDSACADCEHLEEVQLDERTKEISEKMFYGCENLLKINLPSSVESIGESAFEGCSALEEVHIPESIKEKEGIGSRAFANCVALNDVFIYQRGGESQGDLPNVSSIELPDALFVIDNEGTGESGSTEESSTESTESEPTEDSSRPDDDSDGPLDGKPLTLHGYAGSVRKYAKDKGYGYQTLFEKNAYFVVNAKGELCLKTGLTISGPITDAELPNSARTIPAGIFNGADVSDEDPVPQPTFWFTVLEIDVEENGSKLTTIDECAFENTAITSLTLPSGVETIPQSAFQNSALEELTAEGVKEIGGAAFADCESLNKISLPAVETIGESAFENCTGLTGTWALPKVRTIGASVFKGGTKLEGISLPAVETIGESAFEGCTDLVSAEFQKSDTDLTSSLSDIPASAFKGCSALTVIEIPDSCGSIGSEAFIGCESLKEISIPESVAIIGDKAFYDCVSLETVTILQCSEYNPEDEESTGESTITLWKVTGGDGSPIEILEDVFNQHELTLYGYDGSVKDYAEEKSEQPDTHNPDGENYKYNFESLFDHNRWFRVDGRGLLHVLDESEFAKATGTVELPKAARRIPVGIFDSHPGITGLTIPGDSALEVIDAKAFERSRITAIVIPDGVKEIADETFRDASIQTVTFRDSSLLEKIGKDAFSSSALKELKLPQHIYNQESGQDEVTFIEIGSNAFYNCAELKTASLGAVEKIGMSAFAGCEKLSAIQWGENLTDVKAGAFSKCTALTSLDLTILDKSEGAPITWGDSVFEECTGLRTVVLPAGMQKVPANMFRKCTALTVLTLPDSCTTIEQQAFSGCSALTSVNIPAKVTNIATKAFADCQSLIMVTIYQRSAGEDGESTITIAEDAFPVMRLTMRGYDGTVETYAALKGYTFLTLFTAYTVSASVVNPTWGDVVLSKTTARSGELIEVTVTPREGYRLKASSFQCNGEKITNLKSFSDSALTFTFLMPDANAVVTVEFEKDDSYGALSTSFEQIRNMPYNWNEDEKTLTFSRAGLAARLVVLGKNSNPGSWTLKYSSNSSKVVRIDSEGVLYAMGKGSAKITAALKSDDSKTVTFTVNVVEDLEIADVDVNVYGYSNKAVCYPEVITADKTEEVSGDNTFIVLEYAKSTLQQAEQNFTVELQIVGKDDTQNTNYFAQSSWKSSNTALVTLDKSTVYDNKNVVRIKKGATGEACITATVGKIKRSVIIRVIDSTPRLVQNTLTLNARSTDPKAAFEILSVYGYEVVPSSLRVVQAVKKDGITNYETWEYAEISNTHTEADKYYLVLTEAGKTAIAAKSSNLTYSNIYIQGSCRKGNSEEEIFYIPVKSVILTNKALKPSVKLSGKINLFYNGNADGNDRGVVTMTQSLKDLDVLQYRLISAENYKAGRYKNPNETVDVEEDAFANNFKVVDNQILRTDNELRKVKNKVVTGGYLGILYDGYEEFCWVKITVPTKNAKPSYVLSKTKVTVSAGSTGYVISLKLLDKKTKEEVSLSNLDVASGGISINYSSSKTTAGLFYDFGEESPSTSWYNVEDNTICLRLDTVQKGKVTINVQMADWSAPVTYTCQVSVTKGNPKVKAKSATLTLNLLSSKETSTPLTVTTDDVTITDITYTAVSRGNDEDVDDFNGISLEYENGNLTASGGEIVGTYRFRVTPRVQYANGDTGDAKPFVVTVRVIEKAMSMKLKSSTVTLNRLYWSLDEREIAYTVQNMPTGDGIAGETISVTGVNDASQAVESDIGFRLQDGKIYARLTSARVSAGTYKFKMSDLATESGVPIKSCNVTVKVVEKAAKVTAKSHGAINVLDKTSAIQYTLSTSNVQIKLDGSNVVVRELDTTNGKNTPYTNEAGEMELRHFVSAFQEENGKSILKIVARTEEDGGSEEENVTFSASTYKLQIGVVVDQEKGTIVWSKDLNVKPKQTLPKIKTDVTDTTLYAGVGVENSRRSQEFTLQKTTVDEAVISKVRLAGSNSDSLKEALVVGDFDPETQKVRVTLLRPDLLKPNTTYTVKLEAMIQGQIQNTAGAQFSVKIRVAN